MSLVNKFEYLKLMDKPFPSNFDIKNNLLLFKISLNETNQSEKCILDVVRFRLRILCPHFKKRTLS